MNIYVFEPYNWSYCGGACVVVAPSYNEAVQLLRTPNDEWGIGDALFVARKEDAKEYGPESGYKHTWLLTYSEGVLDLEAHVVTVNYNYA